MAIENLQKSEGITPHKSGLLNSHVSARLTRADPALLGAAMHILKAKAAGAVAPGRQEDPRCQAGCSQTPARGRARPGRQVATAGLACPARAALWEAEAGGSQFQPSLRNLALGETPAQNQIGRYTNEIRTK